MIKGFGLKDFFISWDSDKNEKLQNERNVSFEEIAFIIKNDNVIDIIDNPSSNFDNQKCFIIEFENYIWVVPYVENGNDIFLKTAFPSRKHTKTYLNN